ncbi:Retrovirus-related Pol polyprotein from transposon 17.6 [Trichinella sp. T8]|nr:Retrovirus-related Pol polyprotein from transposon 17.6 [Trichinella sp. T8]
MVARYPLQRVGINILGPLEKTPPGNRCVLVLMDNFYKWTAAFPLANMEANTVAKVLVEKYITYIGVSDYLPSDQGRSFEASVVLEMCQLFVIKKTRSFPYHPQGNVQVERFTGALLDMLSIMINRYSGQCDDMLPFVMLANNRSDHESAGMTPAIAMLGRESRLPLDVQIRHPPWGKALGLPDYIRENSKRIDLVHEMAWDQVKTQQRRNNGSQKFICGKESVFNLQSVSAKCHLFQAREKYLGYVVSRDGVQPDPEKIKAPIPKCSKELQQFLVLAYYYRRFVKGFAQIAMPLHRLTVRGKLWNWADECDKAFLHLKARLTEQPVLTHLGFKIPFLVDTDASGDGLGAVLSQDIARKVHVVAYASRTRSKIERKYCATRREMLALLWALKQFRCLLYGRKFTVRTDHGSLTWLRTFKEPEGHVARWLQQQGEFDFEVIYRPGRKHQDADALSRGSCKQCCPTTCTTFDNIALSNQRWQRSPIWPAWIPAQMEREQQKDPDIARMCQRVATKTIPG